MDNFVKNIGDTYVKHTGICSTVSRQIIFAIFALIWGISYNNGKFNISDKTYFTTGLLLFYLFIDILQYLLTAISLRNHYNRLEQSVSNPINTKDEIIVENRKGMKKINDRSFWMLIIKLSILPLAFFLTFLLINDKV